MWAISTNVARNKINDNKIQFTGVNTNTDRITLTPNNTTLFLPLNEDWIIEFDSKMDNLLAFYFLQSSSETGAANISGQITDFTQEYHVKFIYSSTNKKIYYYLDDNLKNTLDTANFNNDMGFRVVDWQGDVNMFITNLKIYLTS